MKRFFIAILLFNLLFKINSYSQTTLNSPNVESILFLGEGDNQPLIIGLGGSEGGNAWASDYWKSTRDQFIEKGYAFLALGYFGAAGTPRLLDKIALEDVYNAIVLASDNKKINKNKIAIVGGSRGGDLALLLASTYTNIHAVVGLVASNAVFPGHTNHFTSSCFTYKGKELPFVPVNEAAVPFLTKGDLRGTFEAMLQDDKAEAEASIKVEHINGPILLISATEDEICPSTPMANKMVDRLKEHKFNHHFEHVAVKGKHAESFKYFDQVFKFLEENFKSR